MGEWEHVHGGRFRGTVCRGLMILCGGGLTMAVVVLCGAPVCGFPNSCDGEVQNWYKFVTFLFSTSVVATLKDRSHITAVRYSLPFVIHYLSYLGLTS